MPAISNYFCAKVWTSLELLVLAQYQNDGGEAEEVLRVDLHKQQLAGVEQDATVLRCHLRSKETEFCSATGVRVFGT